MDANKVLSKNGKIGGLLLAAGLILIGTGIAIRLLAPGSAINPKWFEGVGILFAGWSIYYLVRYFQTRKNPLAARRAAVEDQDERNRTIRHHAASTAFIFTMAVATIALMVYSNMTASTRGPDPYWFFLAFLVIAPMAVYVAAFFWYQNRS